MRACMQPSPHSLRTSSDLVPLVEQSYTEHGKLITRFLNVAHDGWSGHRQHLLGFAWCYINEHWEYVTDAVELTRCPGTALETAKVIRDILRRAKIGNDALRSIVSDTASSALAASRMVVEDAPIMDDG